MVEEEAPLWVPALSRAHTVPVPRPAVNSWALYSAFLVDRDDDQVKVMVEGPVEVTGPNQISVSDPEDPANWIALVHVVTPPPEIDVRVRALLTSAETIITSPAVLGLTAKVVRLAPEAVTRLPTAVVVTAGAVKVKVSPGAVATEGA